MAIYTKTFTKRATVVPDPKVGGAWKTDTFEWSPLPAENCLLVDGQIQTASCRGLDVQPTVLWQIAANTYSAARPCVFDVTYRLGLPVARVDYSLHVKLAVPSLPNSSPLPLTPSRGRIIIFEDRDFNGRWRLIDDADANLWRADDPFWDDRISSFVVVSGQWRLFRHPHFQSVYSNIRTQQTFFGPGHYSWVQDYGLEDNTVSSLLCALEGAVHSLPPSA